MFWVFFLSIYLPLQPHIGITAQIAVIHTKYITVFFPIRAHYFKEAENRDRNIKVKTALQSSHLLLLFTPCELLIIGRSFAFPSCFFSRIPSSSRTIHQTSSSCTIVQRGKAKQPEEFFFIFRCPPLSPQMFYFCPPPNLMAPLTVTCCHYNKSTVPPDSRAKKGKQSPDGNILPY